MPMISFNGQLLSPMLICLQEPNGHFGPRVTKEVQALESVHTNLYITCTKSGKMDKSQMRNWVEKCLAPNIESKSLLLLDAWDGQQDAAIFSTVEKICERAQIPPSTTSMLQPLDRYFFRQYKILRKKISERIQLDELGIDLHSRSNIVKMHSIIHNQLCSSKFEKMIRFAWIDCGYDNQPNYHFENVLEVNFKDIGLNCEFTDCNDASFIRCSHCDVVCCMRHFLIDFHIHL